jgi:hypothetical protein
MSSLNCQWPADPVRVTTHTHTHTTHTHTHISVSADVNATPYLNSLTVATRDTRFYYGQIISNFSVTSAGTLTGIRTQYFHSASPTHCHWTERNFTFLFFSVISPVIQDTCILPGPDSRSQGHCEHVDLVVRLTVQIRRQRHNSAQGNMPQHK